MSNSKVENFMDRLHVMSASSKKKAPVKRNLIDKIFCNFKGNFGKYQIIPMNSVITDFPYVTLFNTREINIPRKNIASDGTESVYRAWIRLLPASAYTIKDPSSGREVSSLTEADEKLLKQAYTTFEELYKELDARNNAMDPNISGLIRRKNYTIFHGHCVNYWGTDSRNPARSGFDGLFVVTAKDFIDKVTDDIENKNLLLGTSDWLGDVYNRDTKDRKGFIMFSIGAKDSPGFNISIDHQTNAGAILSKVEIPEDVAELMSNPVETFLGWQAGRTDENVPSDQRKLFNTGLITEAIQFMTDQLVHIRMAKNNNTPIKDAIQATNQLALDAQKPTNSRGQATNDPVLASMAHEAQEQNNGFAENVEKKNDNPFQTPPAAHFDPMSGAPTSDKPSFGGFGGGNLPF